MADRQLSGWGLLYDMATGALLSRATVVAVPLPPGIGMREVAADLDDRSERWDAVSRSVVPFTNIERAAALAADADALLATAQALDPTIKRRAV